jgi:hypothetical protein
MKQAYIEAEFSHLIAHRNRVAGRGTGTSARLAIARAVAQIFKSPSLRNTRLDNEPFKMTIVITTVKKEEPIEA